MKTKEQTTRDSINKIILNDKCLGLLSELQDIVNKMNPNYWKDADITENFLYKDEKGNELESFWDDLERWIDTNEEYLINDSKNEFKNLTY